MNEVRQSSTQDEDQVTDEPIGIVIALGAKIEEPPGFFAYVWSKLPEPQAPDTLVAA